MADLRLAVLPEGAHPSTFFRLPHPRTGKPALFLSYTPSPSSAVKAEGDGPDDEAARASAFGGPSDGLLELQAVTAPTDAQRSWFVGQTIVSDGRLHILTPIDPIFLLTPLLYAAQSVHTRSLPYQDLFESAAEAYTFEPDSGSADEGLVAVGDDAIRLGQLACVRAAVDRLCDVDAVAADLHTYRLSHDKLIAELVKKVRRLATKEAFDGRYPTLRRGLAKQGVGDGEGVSENIAEQARTRSAVDVLANYLPAHVEDDLRAQFSFAALELYLDNLAAASAAPTPADDWIDVGPGRPGKPSIGKPTGGGKAAMLKKKKDGKAANRATDALKKVNLSNNTKLSGFFKPAAAKPKASTGA